MPHNIYRPTWVEINLDAIEYNIKQMKQILLPSTAIMAVVKANGYGHGSVPIAKKAIEAGVKALAVASLEEAIILRKANIHDPILVLGWVNPKFASIAVEHDITLTVFQSDWLRMVSENPLKGKLNVHVKLDTGMGRIGIRSDEELLSILNELKRHKEIHLTGVFTHFATADDNNTDYYDKQVVKLEAFLNTIKKSWPKPLIIHAGNSAAAIRFPKQMHNYIRFGISMYGLYPSLHVKEEDQIYLKQAFSLHSTLIHVKKVKPSEFISYGNAYKTSNYEWIGTVPIGYGDGWNRKLQGSSVLVDGKRFPIVGRICMDQLMIRLDKEYEIGTKVTLIGKQEKESMEIDEVANYLDTINYEIPCMINNRVPRLYVENQVIESNNLVNNKENIGKNSRTR